MSSPAVPASDFRRACAQFATGVAIATTLDSEGGPHGLTINSFTSVSLDPPMVLICVSRHSRVLPHFAGASHFAVNVLAAGQRAISDRFALRVDQRFDGVEWSAGRSGAPLIGGALAALECRVERILDGGDHQIFLGEVVEVRVNGGEPLLYFDSRYTLAPR
jgi:flavin reductase (DIM6/NTAB) family NADH-FMN oxidoreductase RutF